MATILPCEYDKTAKTMVVWLVNVSYDRLWNSFLSFRRDFCRLKENLDIPAHAIDPNNLLFAQATVGTEDDQPFTTFTGVH